VKNKIQDLRDALFATLEDLRDPEGKLTLDRARAINETAQTIINTAKVKLQYIDLIGAGMATGFIEPRQTAPALTGPQMPARPRLVGVGEHSQ
jgi:hypothetical protein